MTPRRSPVLLVVTALLLVLGGVLIWSAWSLPLDGSSAPSSVASLADVPTQTARVIYRDHLVTAVPTIRPTAYPTATRLPLQPTATPTPPFRPEQLTHGRSETS